MRPSPVTGVFGGWASFVSMTILATLNRTTFNCEPALPTVLTNLSEITYHLTAASRGLLANKHILCHQKVHLAVRLRSFDRVITRVALFASGHRTIRMTDFDFDFDPVCRAAAHLGHRK